MPGLRLRVDFAVLSRFHVNFGERTPVAQGCRILVAAGRLDLNRTGANTRPRVVVPDALPIRRYLALVAILSAAI